MRALSPARLRGQRRPDHIDFLHAMPAWFGVTVWSALIWSALKLVSALCKRRLVAARPVLSQRWPRRVAGLRNAGNKLPALQIRRIRAIRLQHQRYPFVAAI